MYLFLIKKSKQIPTTFLMKMWRMSLNINSLFSTFDVEKLE